MSSRDHSLRVVGVCTALLGVSLTFQSVSVLAGMVGTYGGLDMWVVVALFVGAVAIVSSFATTGYRLRMWATALCAVLWSVVLGAFILRREPTPLAFFTVQFIWIAVDEFINAVQRVRRREFA